MRDRGKLGGGRKANEGVIMDKIRESCTYTPYIHIHTYIDIPWWLILNAHQLHRNLSCVSSGQQETPPRGNKWTARTAT